MTISKSIDKQKLVLIHTDLILAPPFLFQTKLIKWRYIKLLLNDF